MLESLGPTVHKGRVIPQPPSRNGAPHPWWPQCPLKGQASTKIQTPEETQGNSKETKPSSPRHLSLPALHFIPPPLLGVRTLSLITQGWGTCLHARLILSHRPAAL